MPHRSSVSTVINPIAVGYTFLLVVAYYALFILPFRFPPTLRLSSDSYVFGFNNSVAIISITGLLALATLISFLRERQQQPLFDLSFYHEPAIPAPQIPRVLFFFFALIYLLLTLSIYWTAQAADFYRVDWESSHFLWRLKLMDLYSLRPYVDFQFEYGPALIYLPYYFQRVLRVWSVSPEASYYAFHYLIDLLGLYCIFSLLNRAELPSRYKNIAFAILALAAFAPYMGLNGISARFLVPYLSLVILNHHVSRPREEALWLKPFRLFIPVLVVTAVNISISPEIALAFSIALAAYIAIRYRTNMQGLFVSISALIVALAICRIVLPPAYYESVLSFAQGANNFPLLPAPHLLLYLITLVIAVPRFLVPAFLYKDARGSLLFALGILSVALIPGAFGRCDPPHVFFYGLGLSLMMFIMMGNTRRRAFIVYAAAYVCVSIVGLQLSNALWFGIAPKSLLSSKAALFIASRLGFDDGIKRLGPGKPETDDQGGYQNPSLYLAALDKYPQLGLPFANYGTDKITERYLWAQKKIAPEYYVGAVAVYTDADLSRKVEDVSRSEYVLLRKTFWDLSENPVTCNRRREYISRLFIYPVTLPCKHEGIDMHFEISRYIATSYRIIETVGVNIIAKRLD